MIVFHKNVTDESGAINVVGIRAVCGVKVLEAYCE